jgi:hypothetical protein
MPKGTRDGRVALPSFQVGVAMAPISTPAGRLAGTQTSITVA